MAPSPPRRRLAAVGGHLCVHPAAPLPAAEAASPGILDGVRVVVRSPVRAAPTSAQA